jgi:hypothetical protein
MIGSLPAERLASRFLFVFAAALSFSCAARDEPWQQREDNAAWRTECSGCHIAFPPALLSADDWLDIMSNLERHYGADASLDAPTRQQIAEYLARNGASNRMFASRDDVPRITSAEWFLRKHRGAIRMLQKGRVKSLADCAACHKGPEIDRMTGN